MVKKIYILLVLYFLQFSSSYSSLWRKIYLTNLTNSKEQEPHILAPWSRSRLKKKIGAGATWKNPELEPQTNYAAPHSSALF